MFDPLRRSVVSWFLPRSVNIGIAAITTVAVMAILSCIKPHMDGRMNILDLIVGIFLTPAVWLDRLLILHLHRACPICAVFLIERVERGRQRPCFRGTHSPFESDLKNPSENG